MIGEVGPRKARIPGDLEEPGTLGQAVGPNTFGEFLISCGADYDGERFTTIWYRYAQQDEVDAEAVRRHVRTVQA